MPRFDVIWLHWPHDHARGSVIVVVIVVVFLFKYPQTEERRGVHPHHKLKSVVA